MIAALIAATIIFHPGDLVPRWIEKDKLQYKDVVPAKMYFTGTWIGHKTKNGCWIFAPMGKVPKAIMRSDQIGNLHIEGQGCETFYFKSNSYVKFGG